MKYKQLYAGDSVEIERGGHFYCACCDCGLVHKITPHSRSKIVRLTLEHANRRTGQYRRRLRERKAGND